MFDHVAPDGIASRIQEFLTDEAHPAFGQVATVDAEGRPQVRTVHWRYVPERDTFGFSAHVDSPKWRQLQSNTTCSGCYFDAHRLVQWRWTGRVECIAASLVSADERTLLHRMWLLMRPDVRAAYWADYGKANADPNTQCPNCGTILCFPTLWDVHELDITDYRKGRRTLYRLDSDQWLSQSVPLIR